MSRDFLVWLEIQQILINTSAHLISCGYLKTMNLLYSILDTNVQIQDMIPNEPD